MNHRIAIGVGMMALGLASATSAQAQGYYYGPPRVYAAPPMFDSGIGPGEILMRVRAAGLSPLTQPARRGPRYVLLASDRMGGQLRVVVSAYDGRVLRVTSAHDPRFAYHPARPRANVAVPPAHYGAPPRPRYSELPPPELKDPPVVRGSRNTAPPPPVRGSRSATSPATTGSNHDPRVAHSPAVADPTPRSARTPLPRRRPTTASNDATPPAPPAPPAAPPQQSASPTPVTAQSKPAAPPPSETQLVPVAPLE